MDWWTEVGNMASFMPDQPALAVDMAVNGPAYHAFGLDLADGVQRTPAPLEVYPDTSSPLAQLGA